MIHVYGEVSRTLPNLQAGLIQVFCLTFQMEVLEDQQLQMLFIGTRAKHLLFGIIQCHQMDLVF